MKCSSVCPIEIIRLSLPSTHADIKEKSEIYLIDNAFTSQYRTYASLCLLCTIIDFFLSLLNWIAISAPHSTRKIVFFIFFVLMWFLLFPILRVSICTFATHKSSFYEMWTWRMSKLHKHAHSWRQSDSAYISTRTYTHASWIRMKLTYYECTTRMVDNKNVPSSSTCSSHQRLPPSSSVFHIVCGHLPLTKSPFVSHTRWHCVVLSIISLSTDAAIAVTATAAAFSSCQLLWLTADFNT